ncbi:hypothetical protein [Flavobacterium sp.]|uniref:hypothetical protein n=1 Tax=Flavobacterium sp. TaxID=239 RepID=UPI003529AB33
MNNDNFVISEGKRPVFHLILATLLFGVSVVCLYLFITELLAVDTTNVKKSQVPTGFLELTIFAFIFGLNFSKITTIYIDLKQQILRTEYKVAFFKMNTKQKIKNLGYISVFKNDNLQFEVNLWYDTNKHCKMFLYTNKQDAIACGKQFAQRMKIDLLNATEKGNFFWVDL